MRWDGGAWRLLAGDDLWNRGLLGPVPNLELPKTVEGGGIMGVVLAGLGSSKKRSLERGGVAAGEEPMLEE